MSKNSVEENKQDSRAQINPNEISNLLNYDFQNIKYLKEALTRQSAITERHENAYIKNYQRLEFLGDSVLNCVISDLVYEVFPDKKEEDLHPLRSYVIKNDTLGAYADKINLGKFLIVGKGEEFSNIRHHKKVLADLVESLFGAVFIDSGKNYDVTKYVILNFLKPIIYSDKHFSKHSYNIQEYYTKLKIYERNTLPEISELIDLHENSCVISDSSFSDFLNNNKTTCDIGNSNSTKKDLQIISNNLSSSNYITNNNNNKLIMNCKNSSEILNFSSTTKIKTMINKRFDVMNIENLLSLIDKGDELNLAFDKLSQELYLNNWIEFELLYINSNERFVSLLNKNIQSTEKLIKTICMKIVYYLNDLDSKQHYFFSKLLLFIIINFNNEINDFLFKSVFCLLHNGICEYYRKNYAISKQFLEKVFESLNIIEEENNNTNNNQNTNIILEYKFTCVNYFAEIAFIHNDLDSLNECIRMIATLNYNIDDCWKIVQFQKLYVKNYILNNSNQLNKIDEVIEKFLNQMSSLSDEIKSSKSYLDDHIGLIILKCKFNKSRDYSELIEYQKSIEDRCGENSILLLNIFYFYLDGLKKEYEEEKGKKSYVLLEKITYYSYKLVKIIGFNFSMNSKIFIECLGEFNSILEEYANFSSS